MIKIDEIRSQGVFGKISIEDLEKEYLKRIKKDTSPYKILKNLIINGRTEVGEDTVNFSDFTSKEKDFIKWLLNSFNIIITSKPKKLEKIMSGVDYSILGKDVPMKHGTKFKLNDFGKKIYTYFDYDSFRSKQKKGIWLAKQLNIRSCPYCNAQYTLVVNKKSTGAQAKFQFDHFYSKKAHPFLSISLYNLIPSCANCNLAKGDKSFTLKTHYHPYGNDLDKKAKFELDYPLNIAALSTGDVEKLKTSVLFTHRKESDKGVVETHDKVFNISGVYERMESESKLLMRKAIVFQKEKRSLMTISGLFPDDRTFHEYLIGNSKDQKDIADKPMSKFSIDLAKQLGLIK